MNECGPRLHPLFKTHLQAEKKAFDGTGLENNHQDARNVFYVWNARLIGDLSALNL